MTERYTEPEDQIEVFENDIVMYLQLFCEENNIDDLKKEPQSVWNGCMRYIAKKLFRGTGVLKQAKNTIVESNDVPSTFNAYNYELVNSVCDIYIYLCQIYDKEISVMGFSNLTAIDYSVIFDWGNNSTKLSTLSAEIYKKLIHFREESLSNKLISGKQNPVGVLGVLNRFYQWNLPGVSREETKQQALPASELPQLGNSSFVQIPQKNDSEVIIDTD